MVHPALTASCVELSSVFLDMLSSFIFVTNFGSKNDVRFVQIDSSFCGLMPVSHHAWKEG